MHGLNARLGAARCVAEMLTAFILKLHFLDEVIHDLVLCNPSLKVGPVPSGEYLTGKLFIL